MLTKTKEIFLRLSLSFIIYLCGSGLFLLIYFIFLKKYYSVFDPFLVTSIHVLINCGILFLISFFSGLVQPLIDDEYDDDKKKSIAIWANPITYIIICISIKSIFSAEFNPEFPIIIMGILFFALFNIVPLFIISLLSWYCFRFGMYVREIIANNIHNYTQNKDTS